MTRFGNEVKDGRGRDMLISKIVSGGQTGVDRGALEAAVSAHFPYGGLVPKGRKAEDGIVPMEFGQMTEDTSANYRSRTEKNVKQSNATVILNFGPELTGGTLLTKTFCEKHSKPFWVEDLNAIKETDRGLECAYWLETLGDNLVVNFAGPRESKSPGVQEATSRYVLRLLSYTVGDAASKMIKRVHGGESVQQSEIDEMRELTENTNADGDLFIGYIEKARAEAHK